MMWMLRRCSVALLCPQTRCSSPPALTPRMQREAWRLQEVQTQRGSSVAPLPPPPPLLFASAHRHRHRNRERRSELYVHTTRLSLALTPVSH